MKKRRKLKKKKKLKNQKKVKLLYSGDPNTRRPKYSGDPNRGHRNNGTIQIVDNKVSAIQIIHYLNGDLNSRQNLVHYSDEIRSLTKKQNPLITHPPPSPPENHY